MSKKEILIFEERGKFWTTSMDVAEKFDRRHTHVLESIQGMGCSEGFSQTNYRLRDYKDSRGKTQKGYDITRDGLTMLAMGFTNKESFVWKEKYIKAFNRLEKMATQALQMRTAPERIPHRRENLMQNKAFNEAVEEFVKYVEGKSSLPSRYYMIFNNMVNHALFDFPKKLKDIPDKLSIAQLNFSNTAKQVVAGEIKKGLNAIEDYEAIKKTCKERVLKIADAIGVTPIPQLLENEVVTLIENKE